MLVGIDLFDEDVINTLIPIFSMHPEKEYLVFDAKDQDLIDPITKAIKKHEGQGVNVIPVYVDSDDFQNIEATMTGIFESEKGQDIYIDLTGGSELMNACGYKLGIKYGAHLLHVDFKQMEILDINKGEVIGKTADVTLGDYLEAIGAKRLEDSHHVPTEDEYEEIKEAAEYMFDHDTGWKSFAKKLRERPKGMKDFIWKSESKYNKNETPILKYFVEKGFLIENENRLYFRDDEAKEYLTTEGIWLELYMYIVMKEVYSDVELGVVIDWNNRDGREGIDNEIDVVLMYKSIPVFISCKMKRPHALDVCEVGFLAKRLGGRRGQAMMATTEKIKETGHPLTKGIHYKMKEMHVGCIETREFSDKPKEIVLEEALESIGL